MNTSMLESEIKRRKGVNNHAVLWREKLKALLIVVGENRAEPVRFDPELQFYPTLTINPKDAKVSALYKKTGDAYFHNQEFMMAHKKYTQCITHAPAGCDLLALGYGARGITLYCCNYMDDCLIDIERAMKHGYPDELISELFTWKAAALQKLGKKKTLISQALGQARLWLSSIKDDQQKTAIKIRIESMDSCRIENSNCYNLNFKDAVLSLKSRNPTVPGLSKSVALKYSNKYGRHIVATQDIKAGDVIGIQKPYASVVKMNVRYNVCWHCKKQTWTSIACDTCSQVVFCSKDCKKQAQLDYHDIECLVLCQTMAFGMCETFFVALRLVIMALKENNNSFVKLKETTDRMEKSEDILTRGFIKGKLDPTKFESVYGLWYPPLSISTADQQYSAHADAMIMLYYLGKKIELFQEDSPIEFLSFVLSQYSYVLIVDRFINLVEYNSYIYSSLSPGKCVIMASLIVPSLSFFNHSCCPNVIRAHPDGNLAIIAKRPIKTGEQVFDNYGPLWFLQSREDRHKQLQRFEFTCDCQACEEDWSIPEDLKAPDIVENKSFTHGGPYMSKELLEMMDKFVTVGTTALSYIKLNNGPYPVATLVDDFTKFLNKEYENYNDQSYEVFKVGKYLEELYLLSQKLFFRLPGKAGYPELE